MKRLYRYLVVWLFACLVAGVIVGARADAARVSSGSGFTIQGAPVCSSGLPSFGIFAWNGSTFCETQTPQAATLSLGINPPLAVLGVNGSGFLTLVTNSNTGSINIDAAGHWIPTGGLGWGGGTDINQLNGTRATVGVFITTLSGVSAGREWGSYRPSAAMHARRLEINADIAPLTCAPYGVLAIYVNNVEQSASEITTASGNSDQDLGGLNLAVGAGAKVNVGLKTAAAGCGTFAANINATIELTTD